MVSTIPHYGERIKSLLFRRTFKEEVLDVAPNLDSIIQACVILQTSKSFSKLLEIILVLGNYMNGTSSRGGAQGFKLSSINKLVDTKSGKGNISMMNFLVEQCEKKYADTLEIITYKNFFDFASRVPLQTLAASLSDLKSKLKSVEDAINLVKKEHVGQEENKHKEDRFVEVMTTFHEIASKEVVELEKKYENMVKLFEEALMMYGEDPTKVVLEEFFAQLKQFTANFADAKKQNHERYEKEAKERKKQEALAEKEAKRKAKEAAKAPPVLVILETKVDDDGNGLMEAMIDQLRRGSVLVPERRKRSRLPSTDDTASLGITAANLLEQLMNEK